MLKNYSSYRSGLYPNRTETRGRAQIFRPIFTVKDIGSKTATAYAEKIIAAKTVFVNGPMGVLRSCHEYGTKAIWDALGQTTAYTVLGGGDYCCYQEI